MHKQVPIVKRPNGIVVKATSNGAWIEWPGELPPLFLTRRDIENYRRLSAFTPVDGAAVSPVSGGLYVEWPDHSPIYITDWEMKQVGFAIRVLQSAETVREIINAPD